MSAVIVDQHENSKEKKFSLSLTQIPSPMGALGNFLCPPILTDMVQRDSLTWITNPARVLTNEFIHNHKEIDLSKATVTWIPSNRQECVLHLTGEIVTVLWTNSNSQELFVKVKRPFNAATLAQSGMITEEVAAQVKLQQQNSQFHSDSGASADTVSVVGYFIHEHTEHGATSTFLLDKVLKTPAGLFNGTSQQNDAFLAYIIHSIEFVPQPNNSTPRFQKLWRGDASFTDEVWTKLVPGLPHGVSGLRFELASGHGGSEQHSRAEDCLWFPPTSPSLVDKESELPVSFEKLIELTAKKVPADDPMQQ
jgi:hypothetical protein